MIWIIGGTSDTKDLYYELEKVKSKEKLKKNIVITSATLSYKEFLDANIHVERMNKGRMESFVDENKIHTIIDMSHPFAKVVTENALEISNNKAITHIRYEREDIDKDSTLDSNNIVNNENIEFFNDYDDLLKKLEDLKDEGTTFFFTTGSKGANDFMNHCGKNRFIFRVLPEVESITLLKEAKVKMKDIIAMMGPFSYEMNLLQLKESHANYLVTKESGNKGGYEEKIAAAMALNIKTLIIKRPKKLRSLTMEEIKTYILDKLS